METLFIIYLVIVNIVGFTMMGIDKKRAIRGAWRISEASLFMAALIGGSLGCILGMRCFRHKTRHVKFKYGLPIICIAQICILLLLTLIVRKERALL